MEMKKTLLFTKGLCKSYAHNGGQTHILSGVDLEIYEGDFTVIMGASGSGKSTMLYALSGMDRATAGQVMYGELDIAKASEKQLCELRHGEFGFVFQEMHLVSNLSLRENITVPGYLNKNKTGSQVDARADELMKLMGIDGITNHMPSQCSGGEKQRCAIARAIINEPKLLFADEPTGALNRRNTTEVLDLMTELNRRGQSILMVTHDSRAAVRANRILYIEDGKIIGNLDLQPYEGSNEKSRQTQVDSWLSSMKW